MVFHKSDPSATQVAEMRKAFFAGVTMTISALDEIGEQHISEEVGIAYLESLKAECIEFYQRLMREYSEGN
jgi:hypothetical protein